MADGALRRPPPRTLRELEVRAQALTGHTVGELAAALRASLPAEPQQAKGFVGMIVERALGADPRARDGPDFPALGVELKTIPIGSKGRPVESTFCCAIAMAQADIEQWESCRLRRRLSHVLWVPVQAARIAPLPARRFGKPRLWKPGPEELEILKSCLLYTSPSPRDLSTSRMPSSA